jgi:hypothetical protein
VLEARAQVARHRHFHIVVVSAGSVHARALEKSRASRLQMRALNSSASAITTMTLSRLTEQTSGKVAPASFLWD